MPQLTPKTEIAATSSDSISDDLLNKTLIRMLSPLARLCLDNGVNFAIVDEMLKRAFVQEAQALQPGSSTQRTVSRISTTTGISRREVTRLTKSEARVRSERPSYASQLFARWTADPALRDKNGAPRTLKRLGTVPSFETLAQSITRDVHPRSLLDELIRLGLVRYDVDSDCVSLERSEFVPKEDSRQMLDFLADNVGDHFAAAVANVVKDGHQHFEQAVFADELSEVSIKALRPLVAAQWQGLRDALVPALTAFIEADTLANRPKNQRVRIGLYTFSETTPEIATSETESTNCSSQNNLKGVHK